MNRHLLLMLVSMVIIGGSITSCKKNGMNSPMAKKIQYRWENVSLTYTTDYLDGRNVVWTTKAYAPGTYTQFDNDAYFYKIDPTRTAKFDYKVDGDKILYLGAAPSRPTTPQYTDTAFIKYVDDHLLVLFSRSYFLSPAYNYVNEGIDSLRR